MLFKLKYWWFFRTSSTFRKLVSNTWITNISEEKSKDIDLTTIGIKRKTTLYSRTYVAVDNKDLKFNYGRYKSHDGKNTEFIITDIRTMLDRFTKRREDFFIKHFQHLMKDEHVLKIEKRNNKLSKVNVS